MKKIILLLLVFGLTFSVYAQETDTTGKTKIKTDEAKTKIKDNKAKTKDDEGKMKIKDNTDMSSDGQDKTKIKGDKVKMKDDEGKVKVKGDGNMNTNTTTTTNSGMGTTTTTTNTDVVVIGGWRTDPANLPVVGTNIAPEVVSTLKNKYGNTIYDIKKIRSTSGQDIYVMRVMENGGTRTMYVGADGNVVSQ